MNESDEIVNLNLTNVCYGPPDLGLNLIPKWKQLLRDEIVPMTPEDRKCLEGKIYDRGCLITLSVLTVVTVLLTMVYNSSPIDKRLNISIIAIVLAAIIYACLLMKNSGIRKQIAQNKKRIIVTTIEKVWSEHRTKGSTKYFAEINLQPNNAKIEINKELRDNLNVGSLVELHATPETEYLGTIIGELTEVGKIQHEVLTSNQ